MLFLDPPEHSRIRKLLNKEFTPHMIQRMRPRIQQAVNALLDEAAGKSEMEFMTEFANPLPVRVIAEMLGIRQRIKEISTSGRMTLLTSSATLLRLSRRHDARKQSRQPHGIFSRPPSRAARE